MKINPLKKIVLCAALWLSGLDAPAAIVAHYPLDPDDSGRITETVSGDAFDVLGNFGAESAPGARGKALFLDGYTSYVGASVRSLPVSRKMTVSLWVALQSYPVIKVDSPDPEGQTCIVNCLDDNARSGFGFFIGFDGQYSFQAYIGGEKAIVNCPDPLPRYRWNSLAAIIDADEGKLRFYNNGELMAQADCSHGDISVGPSPLHIAQDGWEEWFGSGADAFRTTAFGGLLDDLTVYDEALPADALKQWRADAAPVLTVPASRYEDDRWHPRFHGCPSGAWTNETHGLIHYDGRYHLFFQKNAAGPYMARLHWGHLTSTNLYDWQEERIALAPGEPYDEESGTRFNNDMKGCWSGCVYTDNELTGGRPAILYTGVDYAKARILGATPSEYDNTLISWTKNLTPLIDGRPEGLSDDFRDPYFFRNGENACIVVGSQKERVVDGVTKKCAAVTLHRWRDGRWIPHPDDLFYWGWDTDADGSFIEMPAVLKMDNGSWLFVYTPLGTAQGVKTMYRTGSIDSEGRFVTDDASTTSRGVDLFGKEGYGLLSPSIMQNDGRTIALGIAADKLGSYDNKVNGWAHCYSFPREWSLDDRNRLCQKPAEELRGLRSPVNYSRANFTLSGTAPLGDVRGREAEIRSTWTCGDSPFGLRFFLNPANRADSHASLTVDPQAHTVTVSLRHLPRIVNDGVYDGIYQATLPEEIAPGKELVLDLFIDRSVIDLFVNDRYAATVRVFPHDLDGTDIEAFADGPTQVNSLEGWVLSSVRNVSPNGNALPRQNATTRAAILIAGDDPAALNPQETAALELFRTMYPEGAVLTPGDVASRLSTRDFGTLWIHIDRIGAGKGNLPAELTDERVIEALRGFHADGGNMLLTGHATQFVHRIGRIDSRFAPGLYGDGEGGYGSDAWTLNAQIGWWQLNPDNKAPDASQYYDRRTHPVYEGLATSGIYAWETFPMLGSGDGSPMWRQDHNCLWDLNACSYTADGRNTVERFENENQARIIGTWGHVQDYAVAGVIEFLPTAGKGRAAGASGTILANGLAACELAPRYGDNAYTGNVERLNANALSYLMTKDPGRTLTGTESYPADTKGELFAVPGIGIGYRGLTPGTQLTLLTADGRIIESRRITGADGIVGTGCRGLVIVSAGNMAAKFLIK